MRFFLLLFVCLSGCASQTAKQSIATTQPVDAQQVAAAVAVAIKSDLATRDLGVHTESELPWRAVWLVCITYTILAAAILVPAWWSHRRQLERIRSGDDGG